MNIAYLTHSLASCWNHGNAHFLRGLLRELGRRGHRCIAWEPEAAWSVQHLLQDHGPEALDAFGRTFPDLRRATYEDAQAAERIVDGTDLVIVHEWTGPAMVAALGRLRARGGRFTLLFHDTHHRAVSDSGAMRALDLDAYDGVLAFGESLAEVYRRWGWGRSVVVWHEAADTTLFRPPERKGPRSGLVWIGNWGDGERTAELDTFLFRPAASQGLPLDVHGVRYPEDALAKLAAHGFRYRGWIANAEVPARFARHLATVHVPRRFYVEHLPGIPTIRVFEALASGIPLLSAFWPDTEVLFRPGTDHLVARDGAEMTAHMRAIRNDPDLRAGLVAAGLETILARHTCAHRADELLAAVGRLRASPLPVEA